MTSRRFGRGILISDKAPRCSGPRPIGQLGRGKPASRSPCISKKRKAAGKKKKGAQHIDTTEMQDVAGSKALLEDAVSA